tara:strand:- start:17789 stop:18883 length:1095 start_codon:yes stop_codon:yes gene_type:complete
MVGLKFIFNLMLVVGGLISGAQMGFGQKAAVLKGRVIEKDSGNPISFCTVALVGSSIGSITDQDGFFEIKKMPYETLNIVVSHIAYENLILVYEPNELPDSLIIKLNHAVVELAPFQLEAKGDRKLSRLRSKGMESFLTMVLGDGYKKVDVHLTNDEIIDTKDLTSGSALYSSYYDLNFVNQFLGYSIDYYNFSFYMAKMGKSFYGFPVFTELESESVEVTKLWEANRTLAYNGSIRHFLMSLINDRLAEEGFLARFADNKKGSRASTIRVKTTDKAEANINLIYNEEMKLFELRFDGVIEVFYVGPETKELQTTLSSIKLTGNSALIYPNGELKDPLSIMTFGYFSSQGVYKMLPSNYFPAKK